MWFTRRGPIKGIYTPIRIQNTIGGNIRENYFLKPRAAFESKITFQPENYGFRLEKETFIRKSRR